MSKKNHSRIVDQVNFARVETTLVRYEFWFVSSRVHFSGVNDPSATGFSRYFERSPFLFPIALSLQANMHLNGILNYICNTGSWFDTPSIWLDFA